MIENDYEFEEFFEGVRFNETEDPPLWASMAMVVGLGLGAVAFIVVLAANW